MSYKDGVEESINRMRSVSAKSLWCFQMLAIFSLGVSAGSLLNSGEVFVAGLSTLLAGVITCISVISRDNEIGMSANLGALIARLADAEKSRQDRKSDESNHDNTNSPAESV